MNFCERLAVEPCPLVVAGEISRLNFKPKAQKTAVKVSPELAGLPKQKFAKSDRKLSQQIKNNNLLKKRRIK